jgi:hypothetical protein
MGVVLLKTENGSDKPDYFKGNILIEKVLSFELTINDYSLSTNLLGDF